MNFKLKLGKNKVEFNIPKENHLGTIELPESNNNKSEEDIIKETLENPIGSKKLRDIVNHNEKICIIVSDVTRMYQRMSVYMPYIISELEKAGIKDEDIFFISSLGSHRKQTPKEHEQLIGSELYKRFKIIDHDCNDKDNLITIGTTSRGTPVTINKMAYEADHIVATGAVVYHVMAGWGGGRKSILPGISSRDTIMKNHALSLSEVIDLGPNPECDCALYDKNPINLDMIEAAEMVKPSFMFNSIIGGGKIIDAVAGEITKAHHEGCRKVSISNDVAINELGDMVIASAGGFPKDINLYQSTKTIYNSMRAVKKNGIIIILANCNEGYGNDEVRYIMQDFKNNHEREMELRNNYTIGKFIAFLATWYAQIYNIIYVSTINPDEVKNANIKVVKTIDEALDLAYEIKSTKNIKTYIMPDGSVFPVLKK